VLVDFWTYTCINWLRTLGYIRAWADKYEGQGLVVVGVHTPEFPFERDIDNVRRAAEEMRVEYPVALDSDYAVWEAFDNHYWPAVYIADAEGRIRHHHFGEGGYEECEMIIQMSFAKQDGTASPTTWSPSPRTVSKLKPTGRTWEPPRPTSGTRRLRTSRHPAVPTWGSLARTSRRIPCASITGPSRVTGRSRAERAC
jgi:thiol-disulfide isomerase/thioredoxin